MKSSKLIMGCLATLALTSGMAVAQDDAAREAIAERLEPVGQLCLQGEDCGTAAAADSGGGDSGSDGADGETIYGNVCAACHQSGAAGAPVRGEEEAWAERVEKGFATLLDHSINGFNAMPAKGGNPNLSDAEVEAATAYLVEPVMDVPDAGGDDSASEDASAADAEGASDAEGTSEEGSASDAESASDEEGASGDQGASDEASTSEEEASADSGGEGSNGGNGLDGEALYGSSGCAACHDSGAAGAPVLGDADAWASRLEKGAEELYASAINGIGAMPPKGGSSASDEEVEAIVDYMIEEAE